MKKKTSRNLTYAAATAALYVVLTFVSAIFGMQSGVIQFRLSEILCITPLFTPAAVPGLFVGCLAANFLTGSAMWDVVFGSIATLIGAVGTRLLRKYELASLFCPVVSNVLIVPFIIKTVYSAEEAIPFLMLTVGIGEVAMCVVAGGLLLKNQRKNLERIFREP